MREIFRCEYGSRLFGTALPGSDLDERRVVLPSAQEVLLGQACYARQLREDMHRKMGAGDDDITVLSVQKLAQLLGSGDVTAVETLFAPNLNGRDPAWDEFFSRARHAFPVTAEKFRAYGKNQMLRYAERGMGLDGVRSVIKIIEAQMEDKSARNTPPRKCDNTMSRLRALCSKNPDVILDTNPSNPEIPVLRVSGRAADLGARPIDVLKIYQKALDNVSARRAAAADRDDKSDLKGVYHSLRIIDEGIELLTTGELSFPLKNAAFYKAVRLGEVPVTDATRVFEERMGVLLGLEAAPGLRAEPDTEALNALVIDMHREAIRDTPEPTASENSL